MLVDLRLDCGGFLISLGEQETPSDFEGH